MTDKDEINEQIIETVDEDGKMVKFELLDIVELDELEYALLLPVTDEPADEEPEVVLMKLKKEAEEFIFEAIEDDDEFDRVVNFLQNEEEGDDEE